MAAPKPVGFAYRMHSDYGRFGMNGKKKKKKKSSVQNDCAKPGFFIGENG